MPFLAQEHLPIPNKDILSWIYDEPTYDQDKPIYIDAYNPSNSISASQAKKLIRQLVAGLKKAGLQKGDTVLIHSFNNIYYPVIVLAITGFGGVFTGTNPGYTAGELKHQIQASATKFVIAEPEILTNIEPAANEKGVTKDKILILDAANQPLPEGYQSWRTLLNHGEADWERFNDQETSQNTTAMLLFSSGTTGLPKPAILSHANHVAQHTLMFEHRARPYTLSRLIALPMFHAATTPSTCVSPLRSGHIQVVMKRFDVPTFLDFAEKYQITDLTLVPPMVTAIVSSPLPIEVKKQKLRFIKHAMAGAAPLDKLMQARFQALMSDEGVFTQVMGMTETCCFAAVLYYPENDDTGSVGRFMPNMDVKLIDDDGNDITGYNKRGELCVRGPNVIKGYGGIPRERDFDSDGYFRTGDVLYCDEETKLWYIVDRKKELIKVRGFQVAPAELEGVLLDHPKVLDAAVIGLPTAQGDSELPRAYVIKKPGQESLGEQEVAKWVEERLAKYKRLEGGVKFVETIPKTASGKILKRFLREQAKKEMGAKL
ncbi:putative AMP-binding enzyme [Lophiotrema nucula]|uniref:Putative AMP-binding enzyme n=1 Tax=Lophiotrema nucula TaxID=690887 RepID=A0A6A5YSS2_9PLEO|nr:putative AMP-binding enzyme [Lophiotrema nucula]